MRAQEAFFVGIDNGNKRNFREVETFTQQVYAHKYIDHSGTEVIDNLNTIHCFHIAVNVSTLDIEFCKISRKLFSHTLGERSDEGALTEVDTFLNFFDKVVNLSLRRADNDNRIEKTRRADNLLGHNAFTLGKLIVGRCCANIYNLVGESFKFLKFQRTIVGSCLKAEAVINEIGFSSLVAAIHCMNLRHSHVAFIDYSEEIIGEVVEKTEWAHTRLAAVEVARVVLNARAVTHFTNHFNVVGNALTQSISLGRATFTVEHIHLVAEVEFNLLNSLSHAFF